jgi:hypothetical protein
MSSGSWPNFDGWLQTAWGSGAEFWSAGPVALIRGASNLTFGQNPPYCLDDFFATHPKFFGAATALANCVLTANSNVVGVPSLAGLDAGQFVRAPGLLLKGSVIHSVSGGPVAQAPVHGEAPIGARPGTQFTISAVPVNGMLQSLTWNGLYQIPGVDYTLVGTALTTTKTVQVGDSLWATWLLQTTLQPSHGEAPTGATPGRSFIISQVPPSGTLQVFTKNGVYQVPGVDYVLTGNAILTTAAVQTTDTLWATWFTQSTQPIYGEVPAGAVPGQIFTLSQVPPNGVVQTLTANGQFLAFGVDYVIAGTTVVLVVPLTGGILYATWLMGAGYAVALNNEALATTTSGLLQVYEQPPIPLSVVVTYLRLAYASLVFERWQEEWWVAMGWFIAHYLTLWARSDSLEVLTLATATHGETPTGAVPGTAFTLSMAPPGGSLQSLTANGVFLTPGVDYTLSGGVIALTVALASGGLYATWPVAAEAFTAASPSSAQIAAQGLAGGIQTSKSVGDVSVGYQVLTSLESWGAWNLTSYGQQLVSMAKVIGSGPALIY